MPVKDGKRILAATITAFMLMAPLFGVQAQAMPDLPTAADEQQKLEDQLKAVEAQIGQYQTQLTQIGKQKKTLAGAISQLKIQVQTLRLKEQQTQLLVRLTEDQLARTQQDVVANEAKIARLKVQMAAILKDMHAHDGNSTVEILASSTSLSDFFTRVFDLEILTLHLRSLVASARSLSDTLAAQQLTIAANRDKHIALVTMMSAQQVSIDANLSAQSVLLARTKGKESAYQQSLTVSKQQAAEIRNRIYSLLQVGRQVTFAEAVQVANWASGQTGVRTAFLLAILTQESSLGRNVGTCNRAGDPPSKKWRVIMKPARDQQPFLQITAALGRDPDTTPVSCPMHNADGSQLGWGGAMGPAQFIPSTWLGYADKVAAITGKTADPWDIRDAFIAAAIKLKADGGASKDGEWAAAMRYFSGGTNPAYRFYGDSVVAQAAKYQADIDAIGG